MNYQTIITATTKFNFLFIFIAILSLTSCSTDSNDDIDIYSEKITETNIDYDMMELEILDLVNEHRASIGLNSLTKMNIISTVAKSHSDYMAETGTVSHENFSERSLSLITNANAKSVGENVGFGYATAKGAVKAWLNSDGHRKIIENAKYTHFGISIQQSEKGRNYFTNMFIIKD